MSNEQKLERDLIVMCNWAAFGVIGLGLLLDGIARSAYLVGLAGVFGIVAGFVGHIIINAVFKQSFSVGEVALGLVLFAVAVLLFVFSWLFSGHAEVTFLIGLTLLASIVIGFFAYVLTRYGVSGAFRRFDVKTSVKIGQEK